MQNYQVVLWIALGIWGLTFQPLHAQSLKYSAANSSLKFKIKNAGVGVNGHFEEYSVNATIDAANLSNSHFEAIIKTKTIKTGIGARDSHLRKDDYFDVEKYPTITFKSTQVTKTGSGYKVIGNLKIKGTTKKIEIPVTKTTSGGKTTLKGQVTINRLDYGVGSKSWVLSNDVVITINAVFE